MVDEHFRARARHHSLDFAHRFGGRFLSWPTGDSGEAWSFFVDASLDAVRQDDLHLVRGELRTALEQGLPAGQLRERLALAVRGRAHLQHDLDVLARWELHTALDYGHFMAWMEKARSEGIPEPRVVRFTTRHTSGYCKGLYGQPDQVREHRASDVLLNTVRGGNLGRTEEAWAPVIGPTHLTCHCGRWVFENDWISWSAWRAARDAVGGW